MSENPFQPPSVEDESPRATRYHVSGVLLVLAILLLMPALLLVSALAIHWLSR